MACWKFELFSEMNKTVLISRLKMSCIRYPERKKKIADLLVLECSYLQRKPDGLLFSRNCHSNFSISGEHHKEWPYLNPEAITEPFRLRSDLSN